MARAYSHGFKAGNFSGRLVTTRTKTWRLVPLAYLLTHWGEAMDWLHGMGEPM